MTARSIELERKRYAELHSDMQKQRIKSHCDNKIDGNKGTVAAVWPDEFMPTDEENFRAQIIIDPISVVNRMDSCLHTAMCVE